VGTPDEIRERVPGEFYEVVTADARRARRLLTAPTPGLAGLLEVQAQGDRLHLRFREGSVAPIATYLEGNGIVPESVRRSVPTLENLYISLLSEERSA
jgi:hypothetical protein